MKSKIPILRVAQLDAFQLDVELLKYARRQLEAVFAFYNVRRLHLCVTAYVNLSCPPFAAHEPYALHPISRFSSQPAFMKTYAEEVDSFLHLFVFLFSTAFNKPTPGQALQNLRYRNEFAANERPATSE